MPAIPAAERTCDVLELLAAAGRPLSATVIARECGLPRSSTYQLLSVLEHRGFVSRGHYGWTVGLTAFSVGAAYLRSLDLEHVAPAVLRTVVEQAPVPVVAHVGILVGHETVYVWKESSDYAVTTITSVGVRLPASLTASGRAMLMVVEREQVRAVMSASGAFVNRTGRGPQSLSALRALLDAERRQGYAVEEGFITEGYTSVAAPVLDRNGQPRAAVGLTFDSRVNTAEREKLARGALRCARDLQAKVFAAPR